MCPCRRPPRPSFGKPQPAGAVGKTRLALATATGVAHTFADGVVVVPLHAVQSAASILGAIADALAVPLTTAGDPLAQLLAVLRDKQLLLVLDNTEQLGDAVVVFSRLLESAPDLKLLVVAREVLQLREEWLFPLTGLRVPEDALDPGDTADALQLFVERARQAGYAVTDVGDGEAALRICRLFEGIPLAIELAAAWTRTLSCAAIADEITRGLDVLSARLRDTPARHASMRAVCDQSWTLLSAAERRVWTRLAAFAGGCSAPAAFEVAGASLTMLDGLVGKSLLRRGPDNRYTMHELLRQYGLEQFQHDEGEAGATAAAIGRYYAQFLNRWYTACASQGITVAALGAIVPELDSIRAAWSDILHQSDGELLRRAAHIFQYVYFVRGPYTEGAALDRAGARPARSAAADDRASRWPIVSTPWRGFAYAKAGSPRRADCFGKVLHTPTT